MNNLLIKQFLSFLVHLDSFKILRKILDKKNTSSKSPEKRPLTERKLLPTTLNAGALSIFGIDSSIQPQPGDTPAQCPYCRRIYANQDAVNRHVKKYCLKEKRFGCLFCNYRSKRKDHIVRHTRRVHMAQLQEKLQQGIITNETEAVLQDFNEPADMEGAPDDLSLLDFAALYGDSINDDSMQDGSAAELVSVKQEDHGLSDDDEEFA